MSTPADAAPIRVSRARRLLRAWPAIMLVAYVIGTWYYIASEYAGGDVFNHSEWLADVILSPLLLLAGPWDLLQERDNYVGVVLVYGAALVLFVVLRCRESSVRDGRRV